MKVAFTKKKQFLTFIVLLLPLSFLEVFKFNINYNYLFKNKF